VNSLTKRLLGMTSMSGEENIQFSIITTVHDLKRLPFFERQLRSIFDALGESDELIIVDQIGGGHLKELDLLNDSRVKVVTSESVMSSTARNKGLKFRNKSYVIFFDDDNYMNRFHLSFARSAIHRWHSYDVWYFGCISDFTKLKISYFPYNIQALRKWNLADTNTLIFKSEIFKNGLCWNENRNGCEDWEILIDCAIRELRIKSIPIFSIFLTSDAPNRVTNNHNKVEAAESVKNKLEIYLQSTSRK